jgi:hypothetical protein
VYFSDNAINNGVLHMIVYGWKYLTDNMDIQMIFWYLKDNRAQDIWVMLGIIYGWYYFGGNGYVGVNEVWMKWGFWVMIVCTCTLVLFHWVNSGLGQGDTSTPYCVHMCHIWKQVQYHTNDYENVVNNRAVPY